MKKVIYLVLFVLMFGYSIQLNADTSTSDDASSTPPTVGSTTDLTGNAAVNTGTTGADTARTASSGDAFVGTGQVNPNIDTADTPTPEVIIPEVQQKRRWWWPFSKS